MSKRLLIETGHPAQVHHFRNLYRQLEMKGWSVYFASTSKEVSFQLLDNYNLNYFKLGRPRISLPGKLWSVLQNSLKLFRFGLRFRPHIIISRISPHSGILSRLFRIPHVTFTDTENAGILDTIFSGFADVVLAGQSFKRNLGTKQMTYNGNVELSYLHPNQFSPSASIRKFLGVSNDESYVIVRFVSWTAYHDVGHAGLTLENKIRAITEFSKYAKVFISSEKDLPEELRHFRIRIPPEKMHDALAFAMLVYGESATMASEAAVLGTPAIYIDNVGRGYTDEEESYGLVFNFTESPHDQVRSIQKGVEILTDPNSQARMQKNRERFLSEKIDVTAFMVWFVENYPESVTIMRKDPDYQYRFR